VLDIPAWICYIAVIKDQFTTGVDKMKKTISVTRTSTKIVEIKVEIPDNELAKTAFMRMRQFREKALEQAYDTDFNQGVQHGDPQYQVLRCPANE
jgi:hypothetical protein